MLMDIVHSPISGFGSKYRACWTADLHLYLPDFTNKNQIYVEPFGFTLTMFLNSNCKTAVLNDKNNDVYNFWTVIRTQKEALEKELEYVWIGAQWVKEYAERTDPVGKAVYYYMMNRSSPSGFHKDEYSYRYGNNVFHKDFTQWKKRFDQMISLSIWDLDFREVYRRLSTKGGEYRDFVWYLDPPYYDLDSNLSMHGYRYNFSEQDHVDLHRLNTEMKNTENQHIIISYNDHPRIRELYKDWHIAEITYSTGASNKTSEQNRELLISNRPLVKRSLGKFSSVKTLDALFHTMK